jgi:acetyl esterase/lipase
VRFAASALTIILALLASAGAALIILPAPSKGLALAAIVASEKSALLLAIAALALMLSLGDLRRKRAALAMVGIPRRKQLWPAATAALALAAMVVAAIPLVQAKRLASRRGVALGFGRYLGAPIDSEGPGQPDRTVRYATLPDGRSLSLDVYLPAPPEKSELRPQAPNRPVMVVHGGFWSGGDKGDAPTTSRHLSDLGFTVFDIEYRTAPQPNWKTATGDVKCAIAWIKKNASTPDWHVDVNKLTLLGRSAGGHLVLLAAYTPTDPALPSSCDNADTSVDAVISLYAPTDLTWGYANPARLEVADTSAKLRAFLGGAPDTIADRYRVLSPAERVTRQSPRTLLVHGGRDQFVHPAHMNMLAGRLDAAGVPHDALLIPYAQHGFDYVVGGFSSQIFEAALLKFLRY